MKKGQLQMMEPIIIVIVLVFIAALVLMMFVRLGDTGGTLDSKEALELLQKVTTMPELSCGKIETAGTYCIDLEKARAFAQVMRDEDRRLQYQPLFGFANVSLHVVTGTSDETIILYDSTSTDANVRAGVTYFTVHDPVSNERQFAVLTLRREI